MKRSGIRYSPDGTGYTYAWKVFPVTVTDEEARGEFPLEFSGGPGRAFAWPVSLWRGISRLLAVQVSGLDI